MNRRLNISSLLLLTLMLASSVVVVAQSNFRIPYQAVARDAQGNVMRDLPIEVLISFEPLLDAISPIYQEVHYLRTDEEGYFQLAIGSGQPQRADYSSIDFGKQMLSLAVQVRGTGKERFYLLNRQALRSVPYAFHARSAEQMSNPADLDLRSQSIYWNTSGNNKTRPPIHFIGTRDAQDLVVRTDNEIRKIFTKEGQVQIYSGVTGGDGDRANYPLTIEGSTQGIFIQVEEAIPANANNFMTFANQGGETVGRIEGQTLMELMNSDEYKNEIFQFELETAALVADGVGLGIEIAGFAAAAASSGASIFFAWQVPGWVTAGAGAAAQAVSLAANIVALEDAWSEFVRLSKENIGVAYESGSGDYAEWLPKKYLKDDLLAGEIIGIKGGQVSRNTFNADHVMVVSTSPIILGNAPQVADRKDYEKIAFLGQVPVKVRGPVAVGDYILPSGNGDGFGVAVNPEALTARRHKDIVGIAWTAAEDAPINYVKMAVGLQHNDLSDEVEELSDRVDALLERVGLEDHPLLKGTTAADNSKISKEDLAIPLAEQYLQTIKSQFLPIWQKSLSTNTNLGL